MVGASEYKATCILRDSKRWERVRGGRHTYLIALVHEENDAVLAGAGEVLLNPAHESHFAHEWLSLHRAGPFVLATLTCAPVCCLLSKAGRARIDALVYMHVLHPRKPPAQRVSRSAPPLIPRRMHTVLSAPQFKGGWMSPWEAYTVAFRPTLRHASQWPMNRRVGA